jgi:hypothetical protein
LSPRTGFHYVLYSILKLMRNGSENLNKLLLVPLLSETDVRSINHWSARALAAAPSSRLLLAIHNMHGLYWSVKAIKLNRLV